jgi:hypothetical protein
MKLYTIAYDSHFFGPMEARVSDEFYVRLRMSTQWCTMCPLRFPRLLYNESIRERPQIITAGKMELRFKMVYGFMHGFQTTEALLGEEI